MNKLLVAEFVSLDGVMEGPGPDDAFELAGWTMPYVNQEFMQFKSEELFASSALLLGRKTYDGFAAAWPKLVGQGNPFADKMNSMPKYVVSDSLKKPMWENTHVISGDVVSEIQKLKESAEGNILVCGSSELLKTLMEHNLVDAYNLLRYPVVLGTGKKLFKDGEKTTLKLIEAYSFATGVVLERYTAA